MSVEATIGRILPQTVELRHRLHRIPEINYEESDTAAEVRRQLDRLGIAHTDGVSGAPTATVALVGDASKPCIALRADIDALPIEEQTGLPYASQRPGRMHACGHDGHMSILLGTAAVLTELAGELPVCVKLIFQPAEEGGGGAGRMVAAGVLDQPKVQAIFGLHGWPAMKVGCVATKPGALLAATDNFVATFIGKGCHGAFPHLGRDPLMAAAEAVVNLQQFASRDMDPTEPAALTVGIFRGGTAVNIIPDRATIEGTVRTISHASRQLAAAAVERRCAGIAAAAGCALEFVWNEGYPPVLNDPAMADYVAATARAALGNERFIPVGRPSMGGEDFSYYLEKVPGCFFLVGVEPADRDGYPSLHNDHFDFTDAAIPVGIRMFVELVRRWE